MRIIPILFFGFLLFFSVLALHGEAVLTSPDEIAAYGAEHNLDYKNSQLNVLRAEDNRVSILQLKDSSISFDLSVLKNLGESSIYQDSHTGLGFSSTLSIPIIEQISFSAKISDDFSGDLEFSLNPLAHSSTSKESEISYNSAMISAESSLTSAEVNAIESALDWMSSNRDLSASKRESELAELQYNDDKVRYDQGEITLEELQDSLINWSEARVIHSVYELDFRASESDLYKTLGSGSDMVRVDLMDVVDLEKYLAILKNSLDPQSMDPLKNKDYLISVLNVQSAEVVLKNTWTYEPGLEADAGLSFDSSGNLSLAAGINFSISPDDFQKKKRDIAEEEFNISLNEAEQSLYQAELEFEQVIESIGSSSINSEISRLEFEQTKILLLEAELLHKLGEFSEVDLNESQLTLTKADNSLFKALADEYSAWLELKKNL